MTDSQNEIVDRIVEEADRRVKTLFPDPKWDFYRRGVRYGAFLATLVWWIVVLLVYLISVS